MSLVWWTGIMSLRGRVLSQLVWWTGILSLCGRVTSQRPPSNLNVAVETEIGFPNRRPASSLEIPDSFEIIDEGVPGRPPFSLEVLEQIDEGPIAVRPDWDRDPRRPRNNRRTIRRKVRQSLECAEYEDMRGQNIVFKTYAKTLSQVGFDNRIVSCCYTGQWLFYEDNYFNELDPNKGSYWLIGERHCSSISPDALNLISSVRYAGDPNDMYRDCIQFYCYDYFQGNEEYLYTDRDLIRNTASSFIITGCDSWTLFAQSGYTGMAVCATPNRDCMPGMYPTYRSLDDLGGVVGSVRKGCEPGTLGIQPTA